MVPNPDKGSETESLIQSTVTNGADDQRKCDGNEILPICGSYRLFVAMCGFIVVCSSFASQTSMSSAMVCMIRDSNQTIHPPGHIVTNHTLHPYQNQSFQTWKVDWDSNTQGWAVASFFFGYFSMQIPSGIIVSKFGPKWSMVVGLLITGVVQLVSVPAIRWSLPVLYVIRIVAGLSSGCLFSGSYALASNWAPKHERSIIFGIVGTGLEFGNAFSFLVSLVACESDFQGGWPIIFYTIGSVQLLVGFILLIFVTNVPSTNPYISRQEANYILDNSVLEDKKKSTCIPMGNILRSKAVWGFVMAQLGTEYCFYTVTTQGPIYLRDILRLESWKTNIVSSIPLLMIVPLIGITGHLSDLAVKKGILSVGTVRKINDSYSKIFTAAALVILGFITQGDWVSAFFVYFLAAVGICGSYTGCMANPGDLSPAHTGVIVGLGQGLTTWVSFVIPVVTGRLTEQKTRTPWQLIFYVNAGVQICCHIIFLIFGSGNIQPWAVAADYEEIPSSERDNRSDVSSKEGKSKAKNEKKMLQK